MRVPREQQVDAASGHAPEVDLGGAPPVALAASLPPSLSGVRRRVAGKKKKMKIGSGY